jgi:hypothetical protein
MNARVVPWSTTPTVTFHPQSLNLIMRLGSDRHTSRTSQHCHGTGSRPREVTCLLRPVPAAAAAYLSRRNGSTTPENMKYFRRVLHHRDDPLVEGAFFPARLDRRFTCSRDTCRSLRVRHLALGHSEASRPCCAALTRSLTTSAVPTNFADHVVGRSRFVARRAAPLATWRDPHRPARACSLQRHGLTGHHLAGPALARAPAAVRRFGAEQPLPVRRPPQLAAASPPPTLRVRPASGTSVNLCHRHLGHPSAALPSFSCLQASTVHAVPPCRPSVQGGARLDIRQE